jgi:hypothetical protein
VAERLKLRQVSIREIVGLTLLLTVCHLLAAVVQVELEGLVAVRRLPTGGAQPRDRLAHLVKVITVEVHIGEVLAGVVASRPLLIMRVAAAAAVQAL